jgi:tetratricopeptide (TPR) repeat protein
MKNLLIILFFFLISQFFYGQGLDFKDFDDVFKNELVADNNALKARISNFPQIAKEINSKISAQVRNQNFKQALYFANQLDSILPNNADVKNFIGKMNLKLLNYDDALISFLAAIKLAPENKWLYVSTIGLLSEMNRHEQSLLLLGDLIKLNDKWSFAYFLKATVLANYNKENLALLAFKKAISSEPKSAMIFVGMGDFYFKYGQPKQASDSYQIALQLQPDYLIAVERLKAINN